MKAYDKALMRKATSSTPGEAEIIDVDDALNDDLDDIGK